VLFALSQLACSASDDRSRGGDDDDDGDDGASGFTTTGSGDTSSDGATGSGGAGTSSGAGSSSSVGAGAGPSSDGPFGSYGPDDAPPFKTAPELCAFVNGERMGYSGHERFRGAPWSGEYHSNVTWPLQLSVDATLSSEAQALAQSLASGQSPAGSPYSDGSPPPHEYLWVSGINTDQYVVATLEGPGNWTTDLVGNVTAGITPNNGTARMALFYHDFGGAGPALGRIGCGGATAPGGERWWVVKMAP
jgi:hypothetical protein